MKRYGNQKRTSMRFLPIFPRKDIRQKTQSSQTLLLALWQEVEEIDLHQTMPIFAHLKPRKDGHIWKTFTELDLETIKWK